MVPHWGIMRNNEKICHHWCIRVASRTAEMRPSSLMHLRDLKYFFFFFQKNNEQNLLKIGIRIFLVTGNEILQLLKC